MRRSATLLPLLAVTACSTPHVLPPGRWVDLSHDFASDTIYWPTATGFELEVLANGETEAGFFYAANRFCAAEHGGTHVDAPVHFHRPGGTVDRIPIERLVGPAVVVDVTESATADPDYLVTPGDLQRFESRHGTIPQAAIVLIRTGYGAWWPDRARYLGTDRRGEAAVAELHFPGLHPEAALWLATQRHPRAVGIDTASIDHGQSRLFHSHRLLSAREIPAFENVANLERLPPTGALVFALPMKIRGGSGAPLRIVALVP